MKNKYLIKMSCLNKAFLVPQKVIKHMGNLIYLSLRFEPKINMLFDSKNTN